MGLLKIILILLLVWYVTKLIFRYAAPKVFLHFLKKHGFDTGEGRQEKTKAGDMKIKTDPNAEKGKDDGSFGEYVDFEEIKPEKDEENEK
jgi:hypothetical protein